MISRFLKECNAERTDLKIHIVDFGFPNICVYNTVFEIPQLLWKRHCGELLIVKKKIK